MSQDLWRWMSVASVPMGLDRERSDSGGITGTLARSESWASSEGVRRSMQGNKSQGTAPELALRRAVHALGLRYRVGTRPLPDLNRRADLVFRRARVAVFLDGCYWHGCPEHFVAPKSHQEYWDSKIGRNVSRDQDTNQRLTEAGWVVARIWEHEDVHLASRRVAEAVRAALGSGKASRRS